MDVNVRRSTPFSCIHAHLFIILLHDIYIYIGNVFEKAVVKKVKRESRAGLNAIEI